MDSPVQAFSMKISTIIHATEDPEKVASAMRNLCLDGTPMNSTMNRAKGHHRNEIVTLGFTIRNAKNVESLLQNIWRGFSPLDRTEIYSSLASRIDSTGTLFLRIDKQDSFKGRIRLENSDPIKIEISFRTKSPKSEDLVDDIRRKLEGIQG
jgi:RNA binding exosome subunit